MGVARDGLVQAVKILGTEQVFTSTERGAYHDALKQLSGTDLGRRAESWHGFWKKNEKRLLRARAARHKRSDTRRDTRW